MHVYIREGNCNKDEEVIEDKTCRN